MRAWPNSSSSRVRISPQKDLLTLSLVLLILFTAASCLIVPVPATRRDVGSNNLQGSTSTDFIRVGETPRTEVLEKLGWLKIGPENPKIFWGRWITSASAMAFGTVSGSGDVNRMWGGRNLIVEFDENGRVSNWRTFDDPELPKEVAAWTKRSGEKLDLTRPLRLSVRHRHAWQKGDERVAAQLSLSADQLDFSEGAGSHNFTVAPSNLKILKLAGFFAQIPKVETINITLDFRKKTRAGDHLALEMQWADLLTLLRYIDLVQPQALPPPPKQMKK
jgi:hypothetical protein